MPLKQRKDTNSKILKARNSFLKKSDEAFPKQKQTLCQQRNKVLPVVLTRDLLSAIVR